MSIVDLWNDDDLPFGGGGDDAAAESGDEDSHISDEEADETFDAFWERCGQCTPHDVAS